MKTFRWKTSLLSMSAWQRLAGAALVLAILWLLVVWAQGGPA